MSRVDISGQGEYDLVFGVDHVTGAFVQVWKRPATEQDGAEVIVDSDGIHYLEEPPALVKGYLTRLTKRFDEFRRANPGKRPNIDEEIVTDIGRLVGVSSEDFRLQVYRVFGDDL